MALNQEQRQNITYFTGYEVEHTAAFGMFTLFVVGTPALEEILATAKQQNVQHIYFGTSQSFKEMNSDWDAVLKGCLKDDYWVTLDFGVEHIRAVTQSDYCAYSKFIPMISVKLPNIDRLNANATLKLDDLTWGATNSGVWTHQVTSLRSADRFTKWSDYTQDNDLT